jgi:hypothetical protein
MSKPIISRDLFVRTAKAMTDRIVRLEVKAAALRLATFYGDQALLSDEMQQNGRAIAAARDDLAHHLGIVPETWE